MDEEYRQRIALAFAESLMGEFDFLEDQYDSVEEYAQEIVYNTRKGLAFSEFETKTGSDNYECHNAEVFVNMMFFLVTYYVDGELVRAIYYSPEELLKFARSYDFGVLIGEAASAYLAKHPEEEWVG